jgi:serine/threonine protein kinase
MKIGQYSKEIKEDPFYEYNNFELVTNKSTHNLENLGSGAFGDVYLAKHKKDSKMYAIKQMEKNKIIESGASLDIIYREISIHRRIQHENIIRLYSHYEDDENFFLVMDYSNSGTLFSLIKKNKGIDEKLAFKYFIQTVSAVHFLHENSLVHRDLKPENVLIDENGCIKLCDFGWCVDISTGNRITFCGTYEYMAPEIVKEMPYDYGIDVWSLGILLYELIHGYSPFRSTNDENEEYQEIFKNIIKYNFKIEKEISNNCKDLITSK